MVQKSNTPFFVDTEVIRLTKNGVWLSDDTEIDHEPTRELFARSVYRKSPHEWELRVSHERKTILVEDTAYFVTGLSGDPLTGFTLSLAGGRKEKLKPETLAYRPGRLTCRLENGEEAKFLHAPYFHLLQNLEEDVGHYFLRLAGQRVDLAPKS